MKKKTMHKVVQRLFVVVMTFLLSVGLLPMKATAADVYNIWVGGVQVTSDNCNDLATNGWSYDDATKTLTLNNYNNNSVTYSGSGHALYSALGAGTTLKVVLQGSNVLDGKNALYAATGSMKLTGSGSLQATATDYGMRTQEGLTIEDAGNITFTSSGDYGIYVDSGNMSVSNTTLTINVYRTSDNGGSAISVQSGTLSISDTGDITANGGRCGIEVSSDLTISGTGAVTATSGGNGVNQYGIKCRNCVMSGRTVTAIGGNNSGIAASSVSITSGTLIARVTNVHAPARPAIGFYNKPDLSGYANCEVYAGLACNKVENPSEVDYHLESYVVILPQGGTPPTLHEIKLEANPVYGGNVSGGGFFAPGATTTINATSNPGYQFDEWKSGGSQVSTSASYDVTVTGSQTYTAFFSPISYTISTSSYANGHVTPGASTATVGTMVELTIDPEPNYYLSAITVNKSGGGSVTANKRPDGKYEFSMPAANVTVSATFSEGPEPAKVWVGGVQMIPGYYLAQGAGAATSTALTNNFAYLSPDGKTLTLKNYNNGSNVYASDYALYSYLESGTILTVDLQGSNTLSSRIPLRAAGGALVLTGTGSLQITTTANDGGCGISVKEGLTMRDAAGITVSTGDSNGVSVEGGDFTIENSTLTVTATKQNSEAIYMAASGQTLEINNSNVVAIGAGRGIEAALSNAVTIAGNSVVTATSGGDGSNQFGIRCKSFTMNAGTVTAVGGNNSALFVNGEAAVINGGTLIARVANEPTKAAIGSRKPDLSGYTNCEVYAGDDETQATRVANPASTDYHEKQYVKIIPHVHSGGAVPTVEPPAATSTPAAEPPAAISTPAKKPRVTTKSATNDTESPDAEISTVAAAEPQTTEPPATAAEPTETPTEEPVTSTEPSATPDSGENAKDLGSQDIPVDNGSAVESSENNVLWIVLSCVCGIALAGGAVFIIKKK